MQYLRPCECREVLAYLLDEYRDPHEDPCFPGKELRYRQGKRKNRPEAQNPVQRSGSPEAGDKPRQDKRGEDDVRDGREEHDEADVIDVQAEAAVRHLGVGVYRVDCVKGHGDCGEHDACSGY